MHKMPPTSKRAPKPPKQYINKRLRRVDGGALGTFLPYCARRVWTCGVVSPVDGLVSRRLYNSLGMSLCHSSCESSEFESVSLLKLYTQTCKPHTFGDFVFLGSPPCLPLRVCVELDRPIQLVSPDTVAHGSRSNSAYKVRYIGGRAIPGSTDREDPGLTDISDDMEAVRLKATPPGLFPEPPRGSDPP